MYYFILLEKYQYNCKYTSLHKYVNEYSVSTRMLFIDSNKQWKFEVKYNGFMNLPSAMEYNIKHYYLSTEF